MVEKPNPRHPKRVLFITRSCFWKEGAGLWARTSEMVKFLSKHTELTIAYLNLLMHHDIQRIQAMNIPFKLVSMGKPGAVSNKHLIYQFKKKFHNTPVFDTYIVDKTENSFMLSEIPSKAYTLVDTHDLISFRTISTESFGAREKNPITEEQEAKLLNNYNGVICIQQNEYNKVCQWLGEKRVILAPHPVRTVDRQLNGTVKTVGVVASRWHANIDGIRHFINCIWPGINHHDITFDIYGYASQEFQEISVLGVKPHGFVKNLNQCYNNIDIVINPVRYGAGLKIKTVEALANGLPLVTSPEGCNGLEALADKAFIVANSPEQYIEAIERLINDFNLRSSLGKTGKEYVETFMNHDNCFKQIIETINKES